MIKPQLGTLEKVELRLQWPDEARDFTPWLADPDNIALLGQAIGLELQFEAREKPVGTFSADILAKDINDESLVLIENQLERTDHLHLGQLMTYAAGLDAVTMVWIAPHFKEEHRAAMDWLNKITGERFRFFGLEIELWRIGDSPSAPKFNVVSQPNGWTKLVSEEARRVVEVSGMKQTQLEYWTAFRVYLESSKSSLRATKALPQSWMNIALGRTGFKLEAIASSWNSITNSTTTGEIRAQVSIDSDESKEYFALIESSKDAFESAIGEPLDWYNPLNAKACRIRLRRDANIEDRSDWPAQHAWLKAKLEKLQTVFGQAVRELSLP